MIEESILKEISYLSQGCREKENAVIEVMKKLEKCIDKYLDERKGAANNPWNSNRISESGRDRKR